METTLPLPGRLIWGSLFVCTFLVATAQGPDATVEQKVAAEVEARLEPMKVAQKLGLPYPVPEPTMTFDEVKAKAKAAAEKDTDERFPPVSTTELRNEAQEKTPLWAIGDQISFVIRGGRGPGAQVKGILRQVGPQRIQVDNRWIVRDDIQADILAQIDPEENRKAIEAYVIRKVKRHKFQRDGFFQERYKERGREVMKEAMYRYYKGKWIPAREYFKEALNFRRKQLADQIRPVIAESVAKQRAGDDAEAVRETMLGKLRDLFGTPDPEPEPDPPKPAPGDDEGPGDAAPGDPPADPQPGAPARGTLFDEPFEVQAAILRAGALHLAQGGGMVPDWLVEVNLWLDDDAQVAGKTFTAVPAEGRPAPMITVRKKHTETLEDGTVASEAAVVSQSEQGYELMLAFGSLEEDRIPGTVKLILPEGRGNVQGDFVAYLGVDLSEAYGLTTRPADAVAIPEPPPEEETASPPPAEGGDSAPPEFSVDDVVGPLAALGGLLAIPLAIALLMLVSMWRIFTKAGQPGWAVIIPFFNQYVMLQVAGKPGWWLLLFFIPVVNFIVYVVMIVGLAQNFGKGVLFALGLIFLPVIFYPILAFGGAEYEG